MPVSLGRREAEYLFSARMAKKPTVQANPVEASMNARKKQLTIKQQIVLSEEQKKVLSMVVDEGKSVFFTGSAGGSYLACCPYQSLRPSRPATRHRQVGPPPRNHR